MTDKFTINGRDLSDFTMRVETIEGLDAAIQSPPAAMTRVRPVRRLMMAARRAIQNFRMVHVSARCGARCDCPCGWCRHGGHRKWAAS